MGEFSDWARNTANKIEAKEAQKKAEATNTEAPSPQGSSVEPANSIKWNTDRPSAPDITWDSPPVTENKENGEKEDRRVRLTMKSLSAWNKLFGLSDDANSEDPMDPATDDNTQHIFSASDVIAPLHPEYGVTNGLIFPYTPSINYNYIADWTPYPLTHTNYQTESYNRSYIDSITITGQFTSQDVDEARYSLAAIHFFRTITKMFYGQREGELAGSPPPTLLLSGHGDMMFNKVPVVVKSFIHDLLPDADYVEVETRNGSAWVPTVFNISVTLGVQHNLIKVRREFSISEFASGRLTGKSGGYI